MISPDLDASAYSIRTEILCGEFVQYCAWAFLALSASFANAAGIRGDYVEARTADVFTGPCFSNAEVFIYGNHAVMAWKVTEGSWKGVDLSGLCVAAAVNGTTTFSEDKPEKAVRRIDRRRQGDPLASARP